MIPSLITAVAVSLNEFVDSILVANLIGGEALWIVTLGGPVIFTISTLYTLFGIGGSTLFAGSLGKHDANEAGKLFSVSMALAVVTGFLLLFGGLIFLDPVCSLLSGGQSTPVLAGYVRVLFFTAPLMMVVLTFASFLPANGSPHMATAVNVIANVVNLVMDYVYIRHFGMGVDGAAWATLTGYAAAGVYLIVCLLIGKGRVRAKLPALSDFSYTLQIFSMGSMSAIVQLGYAIKFAFCNNLAQTWGGNDGLIVMSACFQLVSIVSIVVSGINSTMLPLAGFLHGQGDQKGIAGIIRITSILQLITNTALVLWFEIAPVSVLNIYKITEPAIVEIAIPAIRIFSVIFLIRWIYITFMTVCQIRGRKKYAAVVSILDGFALLMVLAPVLCRAVGLTGLWISYTLSGILLLVIILIVNGFIIKKSHRQIRGFWLLDERDKHLIVDLTVDDNLKTLPDVCGVVEQYCRERDIQAKRAAVIALAVEELWVYVHEHSHENTLLSIDMLLREHKDMVFIDFRSVGGPLPVLQAAEANDYSGVSVLRKITDSISYDYVMGMNTMRMKIHK